MFIILSIIFVCFIGIVLFFKGNVDISVLFIFKVMKLYKIMVIVRMIRVNRRSWFIDNFDELYIEMKR